VSELTDCLLTHTPKVFDYPDGLTQPLDPVPWALELFAASLPEADMQSREPGSGEQGSKLTYFDQKDPASFERFKLRIENAQPVHGSLALIDYCAGEATLRNNADWAWQVFDTHFARGADDGMPAELLNELAGVLQSKQVDPTTMRRMLSNWWRLASSRNMYQGPYPERVQTDLHQR